MKFTVKTKTTTLLFITLLGIIGFGTPTQATHFRYGHLTWQARPDITSTTVEFSLINAFRRDGYGGNGPDGRPITGDVINEDIGGTELFFGDNTFTGELRYRIIAFNPTENWLIGLALDPTSGRDKILHTYASQNDNGQPWVAAIDSCCRLSTLANAPDGGYRIETPVDLARTDHSPVSSLPPIVNCPQNSTCTFLIPGADSQAGTQLRWRLATGAEDGFITQPSGVTIDQTTGVVTWNTTGRALNSLWATQAIIEKRDAVSGQILTKVAVDYIIRIVEPGEPPIIEPPANPNQPPVCNATIPVIVGANVTFVVTASHPDPNNVVTLNSAGLPCVSCTTPALPTSGNPVSVNFTWTPTAADVGSHVINFTATETGGRQASCPATITVEPRIANPPITLRGKVGNKSINLEWVYWSFFQAPAQKYFVYVEHHNGNAFEPIGRFDVGSSITTSFINSFPPPPISTQPGSTPPVSPIPIVNGTTYRFRVAAVSGGTESAPSNPWIAVPSKVALSPAKPLHPLLFLHGFTGSGRGTFGATLEFMRQSLEWTDGGHMTTDGTSVTFDLSYPFQQSGDFFTVDFSEKTGGLAQQGGEVARFISILKSLRARTPLSLIAHSNGGLAARSFLENADAVSVTPFVGTLDVADLVTYGTPHRGADVDRTASRLEVYGFLLPLLGPVAADIYASYLRNTDGAKDARFTCNGSSVELSPFLSNLNSRSLPEKINYTSIVGHDHNSPINIFGAVDLGHRNLLFHDCHSSHWDGLVPISSADMSQITTRPVQVYTTSHGHAGQGDDFPAILCAISPNCVRFQVMSPVDIEVVVPGGGSISKDASSIAGASYEEIEEEDGHLGATLFIPFALQGRYTVKATPKVGATPTDKFTIIINVNGVATIIAENEQIQNIPPNGYVASVSLPDTDGDGVIDTADDCLNTPAGAVVNAHGCSIAQLVPCAGPLIGGKWKNHGAYVSGIARKAEEFLAAGLISEAQKDAIVTQAATSSCGGR